MSVRNGSSRGNRLAFRLHQKAIRTLRSAGRTAGELWWLPMADCWAKLGTDRRVPRHRHAFLQNWRHDPYGWSSVGVEGGGGGVLCASKLLSAQNRQRDRPARWGWVKAGTLVSHFGSSKSLGQLEITSWQEPFFSTVVHKNNTPLICTLLLWRDILSSLLSTFLLCRAFVFYD